MFTKIAAIHVHRPIDEVFEVVADARNRPRWDESVESEELTSPEPIGVGATVRTRLRSLSREYEYDWRVTQYQYPRRMTIESTSGPLRTTLRYELKNGPADTNVEFTVTGRPTGFLRLLEPLVAHTTQANLDRSFSRLQRLLDSGEPSPDNGEGPAATP